MILPNDGEGVIVNLKERARQLKRDIPALFMALQDKQTPPIAKIIAGVVVIYALSPVDLIPDFIPVIGYLDDLIILPALITLCVRLIPTDVMARCKEDAKTQAETKKHWYYALPFVAVWLLLGLLVLKILIF